MEHQIVKKVYCNKCDRETASVSNIGQVCIECGKEYRPSKADLTVSYRDVSKPVCEMCGMKRPVAVIMNPNVFPGNDEDKPEHFWDVCGSCRDYINATMIQGYRAMMDDFMERWEKNLKEKKQ